jgi:hypothetical protein
MTINFPEKLDEALVRPGRVDMKVAFSLATREQICELFIRMYSFDTVKRARVMANRHIVPGDDVTKEENPKARLNGPSLFPTDLFTAPPVHLNSPFPGYSYNFLLFAFPIRVPRLNRDPRRHPGSRISLRRQTPRPHFYARRCLGVPAHAQKGSERGGRGG